MTSTNSPVASSFRISFERPSGIFSSLITVLPSCSRRERSMRGTPVPRQSSSCTASHCLRLGRAVAGVDDRVHDVAVVEGLPRRAALVDGVEHVREHVGVAQLGDLVADREEPAARALGLLGHVRLAGAGGEDLEAGAETVVRPDRALGAGDLVAQVHAAAERPADLELAHRSALEPDQRDRVVLGLDRMDERVGPAHHLDGPVLLAHVGADDLDAVAAEIDDRRHRRPAPRPRTRRCADRGGSRASAPRGRPRFDRPERRPTRLQRLGRVDEILEVAAEDACALDRVEHPLRLLGRPRERLRAEHRFPVPRAQLDRLLVQLVRKPDHDGVRLRVGDRLFEVRLSTPGRRCPRRTTSPAPPSGSRRRARGHDCAVRAAFSCRRGR